MVTVEHIYVICADGITVDAEYTFGHPAEYLSTRERCRLLIFKSKREEMVRGAESE